MQIKHRRNSLLRILQNSLVCLILCCAWGSIALAGEETLPDGVKRYFRAQSEEKKPYFFELIENLFKVVLPDKNELPFGKSIAFLVGVSEYEYLPTQLPFVKNDLAELRKFLLDKGGFDEVYVAEDKAVTSDLVADYMSNRFRGMLGKRDRLLFYYSGHGADIDSGTGYMQFSGAKPGIYDRNQNLEIHSCGQWSSRIHADHILFIFDCCASGMGIPKSGQSSDSKNEILRTLSGNGSRTIITAGTAEEESFGVGKHSIFTQSLLNALNSPQNTYGFITTGQLFARIEIDVKQFAQKYKKTMTPRICSLEEGKYRGTFLFIDSSDEGTEIPSEFSDSLNAVPAVSKGNQPVKEYGFVTVIPSFSGQLHIDGAFRRKVESGDGITFPVPAGKHRLELRADTKTALEDVQVEKGKTLEVPLFAKEVPEPPKPETASLTVTCDTPGAVVEFNGQEYGKAPQNFTIKEAGTYTVKVSAAGYKTYTEKNVIDLGDAATVEASLEKENGQVKKKFTNSIGQEFVYIAPGTFMMGSPENEPGHQSNETQHKVTLTKGFYMQTTEVTQGQWKKIMGNNPSKFQDCGDNCPVEQVSWEDAQEFIKKLSRKEGKQYRLPPEAEWEYAARAGTQTAIYSGSMKILGSSNAPALDPVAWYGGNSCVTYKEGYDCSGWPDKQYKCDSCGPHPVGKKEPNAFGLYDMLGNVWEWCQDWYGDYPAGSVTDPDGPSTGSDRVGRGGSWGNGAVFCRSAGRGRDRPGDRGNGLGGRPVLSAGQQ